MTGSSTNPINFLAPDPIRTPMDAVHALITGKAKLWMLLLGETYAESRQFPVLSYAASDCQELKAVLDQATHSFQSRKTWVYNNHTFQPPTLNLVRVALQQIMQDAKPEDTIVIYCCGHCVLELSSGQPVLCLANTRRDDLRQTGLWLIDLLEMLKRCAANHQLLWLDVCHSQSSLWKSWPSSADKQPFIFDGMAQILHLIETQAGSNVSTLLACDVGQHSWDFAELQHGVFTYFLIQGLQGAAANTAGVITTAALADYVSQQTVNYIRIYNRQVQYLNQDYDYSPDYANGVPCLEYSLQTPILIGGDRPDEQVIGLAPGVLPHNAPTPQTQVWPRSLLASIGGILLAGLVFSPIALQNLRVDTPPAPVASTSQNDCTVMPLVQPPDPPITPKLELEHQPCGKSPWHNTQVHWLESLTPAWSLAFTPDGQTLVSGHEEGLIQVWSLVDQRDHAAKTWTAHKGTVYTMAMAPSGQLLATGSADGTVKVGVYFNFQDCQNACQFLISASSSKGITIIV